MASNERLEPPFGIHVQLRGACGESLMAPEVADKGRQELPLGQLRFEGEGARGPLAATTWAPSSAGS
jgi:hypothetical protein